MTSGADHRFNARVTEQLDLLMSGTEYGDEGLARAMRAELGEKLAEERQLTVYQGFDPTSPHVHVGHAVGLGKLAQFQGLGHRVIFLIGDFTARIGDPSGRSRTRPPLSPQEIEANARTYTDQAFRILDRARTEIAWNATWLARLGLEDVLRLLSGLTMAQVLLREDFRQRHEAGVPIHLHELLYALLQGYDAAHLQADVQLGGIDQLFNLLTGRDVMRAMGLSPQVAITVPLLVGLDGRQKMSKSYGNDVGVTLDPDDMYGKVMSLPDAAMRDWLQLASGLPPAEAGHRVEGLASGALHPRDAKMELARLIVTRWHDAAAADRAEAAFVARFQKAETPADAPPLRVPAGVKTVLDLVVATGVASSKSDARRLVAGGGVELDGVRLADWKAEPPPLHGRVLRVGKRHWFRLEKGSDPFSGGKGV
jgi:tyrosyl-tRNA synthetase